MVDDSTDSVFDVRMADADIRICGLEGNFACSPGRRLSRVSSYHTAFALFFIRRWVEVLAFVVVVVAVI